MPWQKHSILTVSKSYICAPNEKKKNPQYEKNKYKENRNTSHVCYVNEKMNLCARNTYSSVFPFTHFISDVYKMVRTCTASRENENKVNIYIIIGNEHRSHFGE